MPIRPLTTPKPFGLVLMPFDRGFDDIYEFGIKGACDDAGVYCERLDEQIFSGSILERLYSQISKADILIGDMTGRNANVFYEVGYAHALGKNVVLLTSIEEDIPFDLKHFPHIIYGKAIKNLRASLARKLGYLIKERPSQEETKIGIELFVGGVGLSKGDVVATYDKNRELPGAEISVVNDSARTYAPGDFRIAVIAPPPFDVSRQPEVRVSRLPDGSYMYIYPLLDTLFPGAALSLWFGLDSRSVARNYMPKSFEVKIRVLSSAGFRDFPLGLRDAEIEPPANPFGA